MFFGMKLDVCALSMTKLKRKGEVIGRMYGTGDERARDWWTGSCSVEWNFKEVQCRLMWVRVMIKHESLVFLLSFGPGSKKSE